MAELTVLGAGSILPRAGYGCAGYALRPAPGAPVTLLDCGPGSIRALAAAGIGVGEVRRVVFSHYHLDHCLDLFALAFARHNPALAAVGEIELVGPRGLRERIEGAPGILG
ncbi:MAG TPA: MBL fold metallo-hydrolase, partial [Planctomycetota bacterium]